MCGICGFNWEDKELLKEMTALLHHRGPDGGGFYTDTNLSLGHRRLSIIDLSKAGRQPMANEDGSLWLTYNGEIYNFPELRQKLEKSGHRFQSNTDSEVVIHAYEEWGEECLSRFNGMFAFCLYDQKKQQLFLARDRLGIKAFFYFWNPQTQQFIFASEIKALLLADIPRELNPSAARQYLQLRYTPGEATLFQNIKKLLPGYSLTLDLKNHQLEIQPFWDVPLPQIKKDSSHSNQIKELLLNSIEKRLIADVPVGVYLSGGIDSAAITALTSQLKEEPVKTFSVGFDYDDEVDELYQAKKIANHFETDHHEIIVEERISPLLPKLLWHLDLPHGDPVIIPQFKLSQLASQKVKVVLSGEGADEIYAGYVQYKSFLQAQKAKIIPSFITSALARKVSLQTFDKFFDYPSSLGEKGKEKIVDFLSLLPDKSKAYHQLTSIMTLRDNQHLFTEQLTQPGVGGGGNGMVGQLSLERQPLLNQLLYYDTKRWLPNYVLFINDRMTMAHSIEGRVPFLDHRLVEHSTTLPINLKLTSQQNKIALRQTLKDILPQPEIKKHPFYMPLDKWYQDELKYLAETLFTHQKVKQRGYFNHYYLKKIWENYHNSKLLYGKQLFTLINFELWHRIFLDQKTIPKNSNINLNKLLQS